MENGKLHFADMALDSPEHAGTPDRPVRVFIRPHDVEVDIQSQRAALFPRRGHADPFRRARTSASSCLAESGERVHAELTQERYRALNLSTNSQVFVTPRDVKVFSNEG